MRQDGGTNDPWMVMKLSILVDVHQYEWYDLRAPLWMLQKLANSLENFTKVCSGLEGVMGEAGGRQGQAATTSSWLSPPFSLQGHLLSLASRLWLL